MTAHHTAPMRHPSTLRAVPRPWAWVLLYCWVLAACAPAHQPETSAPPPSTESSASPSNTTAIGQAVPARGSSDRYAEREDVRAWAYAAARSSDLSADALLAQLASTRRQPAVVRAVTPSPKGREKNWAVYRARFVEPQRTQAGLAFWNTHAATLARAEQQFGVPASLIVGVIGVETLFGRHLGDHRVIDALATLAFDFPTSHPREAVRTAFYQQELLELFLLAREQGLDPQSLRGSYAGAMGWPQFLPSSWRRYAIDFDRDGRIDLINNPVDVIGSVANYFVAFGWKPGMPTHYPVQVMASPKDLGELLAPDILPTFDVGTFVSKGAVVSGAALKHSGRLALVELENGFAPPSHIAGTHNFYVVTRYNWSSYYALAVIELGEHIQAVRQRPAKPKTQRAVKAKTKPARSSRSR